MTLDNQMSVVESVMEESMLIMRKLFKFSFGNNCRFTGNYKDSTVVQEPCETTTFSQFHPNVISNIIIAQNQNQKN